jgi:hypothetical protein
MSAEAAGQYPAGGPARTRGATAETWATLGRISSGIDVPGAHTVVGLLRDVGQAQRAPAANKGVGGRLPTPWAPADFVRDDRPNRPESNRTGPLVTGNGKKTEEEALQHKVDLEIAKLGKSARGDQQPTEIVARMREGTKRDGWTLPSSARENTCSEPFRRSAPGLVRTVAASRYRGTEACRQSDHPNAATAPSAHWWRTVLRDQRWGR